MSNQVSTHRVYLRWPLQKTSHKTTTEVEAVAAFAFEQLKQRKDLVGKDVGVAWTLNGKQVSYYPFSG